MPTEPCRVCGSNETFHWKARSLERDLEPSDLRITDSRYGFTLALLRCSDCGFIFAAASDVEDLTALYERLTDPGYEESQASRVLQMRWLLDKALEQIPDAADVLDIGAGTGLLVRESRALGLSAVGIEPSVSLVDYARDVNGVDLIQGVFPHPSVDGRTFDLVFLVDVIEHVATPLRLLRQCRAALKPDGLLLVVTPDVSSMAAKLLRKRWWHVRLAHVGYFNRTSFGRAAAATNLVPTRWLRAKWFFEVGYLAERAARYLPIGWLNRHAEQSSLLRRCYKRVIPLNLHDSYVVFLRAGKEYTRDESV